MIFTFLFGLSMDYRVFILTRTAATILLPSPPATAFRTGSGA